MAQPDTRGSAALGNTRYEWDLRLNNEVPSNPTRRTWALAATPISRLGTLYPSRLTVNSGAGNMTVDLSGTPRRNLDATINGGARQHNRAPPCGERRAVVATGGLANRG